MADNRFSYDPSLDVELQELLAEPAFHVLYMSLPLKLTVLRLLCDEALEHEKVQKYIEDVPVRNDCLI